MNKPVYNVRIDPGLYEFYTKVAVEEGRSITSQINHILRQRIPRELYRMKHNEEHKNMSDAERAKYEAHLAISIQRGLAWRANKTKSDTIRFKDPDNRL